MSATKKTSLGLDLIDISQEKLAESRVKVSANFALIDQLFQSDIFDTRYYTKTQTANMLGNYLAKDNTIEYSPSSRYEPATKGYVDMMASTGGGNVAITQIFRYVSTEGQTTYSATYILDSLSVFLNGVELDSDEYTAGNGTSVVLTTPAVVGDVVRIIAYGGADVYNKTQVNNLMTGLTANVYDKTTSDANYAPKDTTYSKTEVDTAITNAKPVVLNGLAPYHLISGSLSLQDFVITNGFSVTPYAGTSGTQTITTGVDAISQWGDNVTEMYGAMYWLKNLGASADHFIMDTVRGTGSFLQAGTATGGQATGGGDISAFTANGFTLSGANARSNLTANNYISYAFQTTHRFTGVTNHGKAITVHYNPISGFFTAVFTGSGAVGHEITHFLNRRVKLAFVKSLGSNVDWLVFNEDIGNYLVLNSTAGRTSDGGNMWRESTESYLSLGVHTNLNAVGVQHVMYGWADSFYDAKNNLIGNYEFGLFTGGTAGFVVPTKAKPALVLSKRVDTTGNWWLSDLKRNNGSSLLVPNLPQVESVNAVNSIFTYVPNGLKVITTSTDGNASGGTYMYLIVYDNDSGSGRSKYNRPVNNPTLTLNAAVPFAKGTDANGAKNTMVIKNETLPALTLSQGKNYVCLKEDGTYVSNKFSPQYGAYNGTGVYFDIFSNKWYPSPSVINQDFNDGDTAGWTTGTAGALSIAGGELKLQHNGTNYPTISKNFSGFIVGKRYAVRVTLGCSDGVSTTPLLGFSGLSVPQSVFGIGKQYAVGIATATTVNIQLMAQTTTSGVFATMEDLVVYPINNDGSVDLSDVVETPSRNFLDAVVYADQNGQAVYVEQLSKTEYKDIIKANEFIGQNSIFALAVVDMTTTPPTLVKGYNVKSMLLTATGKIRLLYKKDAMDANYAVLTRMGNNSTSDVMGFEWYKNATVSGVEVGISNTANAVINANRVSIIILGGY